MIKINGKSPSQIKLGDKGIRSVYLGDDLIWTSGPRYQELPYIVSNGNSWADTGLYLDPSIHRVQGSFIIDDLSMVSTSGIYPTEGARTNNTEGVKVNTTIRKLSETTYEIRRDWGIYGASGQYDGVIYEVGKEYVFDYTPEYTQIGDLRIENIVTSNGLCGNTYYIGFQNDTFVLQPSYNPPGMKATGRTFSVWSTGELIGESVPVYDIYGTEYKYYDKTTGEYLENKGTEPFTQGETDPLLALHSGGFLKLHSGAFLKLH